MEDFIIILIGFAVMLYSAYSKNKKSKERQAGQNEVDGTYDDNSDTASSQKGKDLIEQFFGYDTDKSDHPFESENTGQEQESFRETSGMHTKNIRRENVNEGHINTPYNIPETRLEEKISELPAEGIKSTKRARYEGASPHSRRRRKKKRIDLRSAVIYSEILNRKY